MRALLGRFFGLLRPFWGALAVALGTLTLSTLLALIPPASMKFVVDHVLDDRPLPPGLPDWLAVADRWQFLVWLSAAAVAISLAQAAVHLLGRWKATQVTKRVQLDVRRRLFEHVVRLPLHRVYEIKSGGVASVLREDAGSVGELVFGVLYNPWRAVIQLVGSMAVLAWIDWRLLLGTLLLVPLVVFTHNTWTRRIRPLHRDVRGRRQEIDSLATETFGGIRVVRAFSRQRSEAIRFVGTSHLMGRQELVAWWWSRGIEVFWGALVPLGTAAMLLYGGGQVLAGNLTVGDLTMFLVYLLMMLGPIATLAESATTLQNGLSALDRVLDLLDEPREMPPTAGSIAVRPEDVSGRIDIERVWFRYPGTDADVLCDVSLSAAPGDLVALVGTSGAGKTTLCNLVARFYDPTEGRVRLDGRDLREIDVESYRSLLGIVEQDVFLFDGTVADNIAFADRRASMDEIRRAADAAHATEFIERLPDGFDTVVGERGVKLSGGQRQRLAIARAVLADPKVLILDEATSNLDSESEQLIQLSLADLMRGRTSFVIAHRLSTILHATRIVVLDGGRVLESGTHEELMRANGRYRAMVQLQFRLEVLPFG